MKIKITLTIITLVLNALVNAQTLQISGKVTDEQNAPVEYADVLLCKNAAVTQYCMSDMAGVFSLAAERGTYDLIIRQLGDTLYAQTIDLQQNIDLGKIAVAQKSKILQEVTVTVQKPLFERKADRMVFNTANLPSADGGDALDLLKLTPSLLVDDNSISIVGKGLMAVMINNRVVQLSGDELINFLKGLRANDIQSVEVITTPPAKYEAEGNGGMINIVLKKTPQNLWNASIFGSYEQTKYGYGNIGGNFNYRKNRLSLYANLSHGRGADNGDDEGRIFYPTLQWKNASNSKNVYNTINARTGFDYIIADNWTIGAQYIGSFRQPNPSINNSSTNIFNITDSNQAGKIETIGNSQSNPRTHSANVHSSVVLDTLGRIINFDFDALNYNVHSNSMYESTTSGSQDAQIPNGFVSQRNLLDRKITNYSAKIDVEHPIKTISLNYGVKLSFSNTNNDIHAFDLSSGTYIENVAQSNQFLYKENTQAVYISASTAFGGGKWQAQAGLRGENTQFKGNSVTMDTVFKKSYFELFPSAYLSYNMNEKNVFYAEYGRRISRPGFSQLNPFRSYSSPYYYFTGNPELLPIISNDIQLGYVFNNALQAVLSYTNNKNNSGGGIELLDKDGFTRYGTRLNYFDDYNYGIGLVAVFNILGRWVSQNSVNAYYNHGTSKIYPLTPKTMEGYGAFVKTSNIIYLNKSQTFSTGFDFMYAPPQKNADMTESFYRRNFNAFFKMLFLDRKLSVTLSGNNLLNDYSFNWKAERSGMTVYSKAHYNPRSVRLSVSYNFGSSKVRVQQHQNSNEDELNRAN